MSAIQHDAPDHNLETPEHEPNGSGAPDALVTPSRRRWRLFNRKTAALAAVVTAAAGFLAGVEIEKSQVAGTATAAIAPATGSAPGATGAGARGGFPFAGRGGGAGGGNASFGTVSSVNGNTIYVTEPNGNTVKVTLSSATKVTKSQAVSKSSLRPGDAVVIQGATSSNGTISATSVSDSGTSPARAGSGGGASSTTSGGAGAAGTGTTG